MITPFQFATATRIVFGWGEARRLASLLPELRDGGRIERLLIVTGKQRQRAAVVFETIAEMKLETCSVSIEGEPSIEAVEGALSLARAAAVDGVLAVGGGSVVDAGKAIAALLANPGSALDYLEVIGRGSALTRRSLPFAALPTTAGTGAEVTKNAVLASHEHHVKVSLRSNWMLPDLALVDPELTVSMPSAVTACTGLDALTQVLEPYVSLMNNPLTDGLCVEGMRRAARSLVRACRDGGDREAREDMAVASLFGGLALANAKLGAVHGFAGPLGGMFDAPHGALCARLCPPVLEANVNALRRREPSHPSLRRYDEVGRLLTGRSNACAEDAAVWLRDVSAELAIPALAAYGMTQQHIPEAVEKAARASSMKGNPLVLTEEELAGILERAL